MKEVSLKTWSRLLDERSGEQSGKQGTDQREPSSKLTRKEQLMEMRHMVWPLLWPQPVGTFVSSCVFSGQ